MGLGPWIVGQSPAIPTTQHLKPNTLVSIVPLAGEDDRHAVAVGYPNQLGIAARPTWLDDRGYPSVGGTLDRVREWEEAVRRQYRSLGSIASFAAGQVDGVLSARLA